MYSNKENVNILTALLVDYGIRHVVVCPGSRNAPLVHNFNECPGIQCHPVTDERSAAFVAMGISQQTGTVAAVCVTSGSALLNVLPGAAEATYQRQGIIVISADRPAAWTGQLDGQTMPQQGALGSFVGKSVYLPECKDDVERWQCRRLVCEAVNFLIAKRCSVHINVPITEPLFGFSEEALPVVKGIKTISSEKCRQLFDASERPMIVCGQGGTAPSYHSGVVVLAEQLSSDNPVPSLDTLFSLMDDGALYKPDFLVFTGRTTVSKRLRQFLRTLDNCIVVMHNPDGDIEDVTCHARYITAEPLPNINKVETEFTLRWRKLVELTARSLATEPSDLCSKAVKAFESLVQKGDIVYYANSSAVRLGAKYAAHRVRCNRGLNGIEGSLSTAVGASLVTDDNVYCVIGDLSFFYDQNALWNQHLKGNLRILLLNGGGGAIFRSLPGLDGSPALEEYVMASHKTTAVGACHQYGVSRRMVSRADELAQDIEWLVRTKSNRPLLLEVLTI
jgi:2-succinyl-5-enolpyruvyl-6-hydroxy-3-cyclohexene-1-carboxylate synthase